MQYTLNVIENIYDYISEYYEELDSYITISNKSIHNTLEVNMENVILDISSFEILDDLILQNPNGIIHNFSHDLDKSDEFIDISLFLSKVKIIFTGVSYAQLEFKNSKDTITNKYLAESKFPEESITNITLVGNSLDFYDVKIYANIGYQQAKIIFEESDISIYTINFQRKFSISDVDFLNTCKKRTVQLKNLKLCDSSVTELVGW